MPGDISEALTSTDPGDGGGYRQQLVSGGYNFARINEASATVVPTKLAWYALRKA